MTQISQRLSVISPGGWLGFCCAAFIAIGLSKCVVAEPTLKPSVSHVINIIGGHVDGSKVIKLTQGDRTELQWVTDRSLHIHLHGYDIEAVIGPDSAEVMMLDAYATGRFPVTTHLSEGGHAHGAVEDTLIYIEVYPR